MTTSRDHLTDSGRDRLDAVPLDVGGAGPQEQVKQEQSPLNPHRLGGPSLEVIAKPVTVGVPEVLADLLPAAAA